MTAHTSSLGPFGLGSAVFLALFVACGGGASSSSGAAPTAPPAPRNQTFGHGAEPSEATRTVEVQMSDDLHFRPAEINVKRGETVSFHLINTGQTVHEFTIGGPESQELHEDQMAAMGMDGKHSSMNDTASGMAGMDGMAGMKMDKTHKKYLAGLNKRVAQLDRSAAASDSVHVPPGESRDLVWAFTGVSAPTFGCHIPGHWSGGMKGSIVLS